MLLIGRGEHLVLPGAGWLRRGRLARENDDGTQREDCGEREDWEIDFNLSHQTSSSSKEIAPTLPGARAKGYESRALSWFVKP